MTKQKRPSRAYTVNCVSVYAGDQSMSCLTVQRNEDGDASRSQIQRAENYPADKPTPIFDIDETIWTMWMSGSETYHAAASRTFITGREGAFRESELPLETITAIWGYSDNEVYVIGDAGQVRRFDGRDWTDMSIEGGGYLYAISGVQGRALYVCGDRGQLYRHDGKAWRRLDVGTDVDLYGVCATELEEVLVCGRSGFAAQWSSETLTRLTGDPSRDYYDVVRFRNEVYFAAGDKGTDKLDGRTIASFKDKALASKLSATDRYLCACGGNQIARFDGTGWLASRFD